MIVHNKTKSVISFPVDHTGSQVASAFPGWSEVDDNSWFSREVELTEEHDIKKYGKKVNFGAEKAAKQRIDADEIEVLGEVKAAAGAKTRKSLTIADVDYKVAVKVVGACNRSDILKAWKSIANENLRIEISNRLEELKVAAETVKKGK
jgi:hypothetical protein